MTVAEGITACSNSNCFAPISVLKLLTPVILPPGRLRLATTPIATGSVPVKKAIGIVVVAAFAASTAGVVVATITVTRRRTRSSANPGSRSFRPSAQRYSIATFLPSTKLASFKPWRNARNRSTYRSGNSLPRKPITGIACCARAASGHVMAEPATALMKSRRRIARPKA